MYVSEGDKVILIDADSDELKDLIGSTGTVLSAWYSYHPAVAQVFFPPNFRCDVYVSHLEILPPEDGPLAYQEKVKIISEFNTRGFKKPYQCNKELIGRIGEIHGYDRRFDSYLVKCSDFERGWFPANCLVPITYKGARFYYPSEKVIFKGTERIIDRVKRTKNNYGQLLLIDGDWIPASDVLPSKSD